MSGSNLFLPETKSAPSLRKDIKLSEGAQLVHWPQSVKRRTFCSHLTLNSALSVSGYPMKAAKSDLLFLFRG